MQMPFGLAISPQFYVWQAILSLYFLCAKYSDYLILELGI